MIRRNTNDDPPQALLVTEQQAADILNISKRLLWSLNNQGLIACVRLANAKRYSYVELERFIEAQTEKPTKRR